MISDDQKVNLSQYYRRPEFVKAIQWVGFWNAKELPPNVKDGKKELSPWEGSTQEPDIGLSHVYQGRT